MSASDTARNAIFGNPPVEGHKPSRAGVVQAFEELELQIGRVTGGFVYYDTKAEMDAVTPGEGDPTVAIVTDDGANSGIYAYRDGSWEEFTEFYDAVSGVAASRNMISCSVSVAGSIWTLTPKDGQVVIGNSSDQIVKFDAPVDNPENLYVVVVGVNDGDPRLVKLSDQVNNLPASVIKEGALTQISFRVSGDAIGSFQLVTPSSGGAVGGSDIVVCNMSVAGSTWTLTPKDGQPPVVANGSQRYVFAATQTNPSDVYIEVIGLNSGDPRSAVLSDQVTNVPAGLISIGGFCETSFRLTGPGAGRFELINPAPTSGGGSGGGSLTAYEQIQARRTADNSAKARETSRKFFSQLGTMAKQLANAVAITGGWLRGLRYIQVTNNDYAAPSGSGVELFGGSSGVINGFNRGTGEYINLLLDGAAVITRVMGSTRLTVGGNGIVVAGSMKPLNSTVANVPSASLHGKGATIYVTNESGGEVLAVSDGTNWRRTTDRAIIS